MSDLIRLLEPEETTLRAKRLRAAMDGAWPHNRNHEAARRHVNQILRDHGRPDYSRRETQIAELLDELIRERDEARPGCRCIYVDHCDLTRADCRQRAGATINAGGGVCGPNR